MLYSARKNSPVTAACMLANLSSGQRERAPYLLSIRHVFNFATACSAAARILLEIV